MPASVRLWTPARIRRLEDLAQTKRSAAEISEILSKEWGRHLTRNAIAGACARNGIALISQPPGGVRKKAQADPQARAPIKNPVRPPEPVVSTPVSQARTRGKPVSIFGRQVLSAGQDPVGCRHIDGIVDPSLDGWRYCQQPTGSREVYCKDHQNSRIARA